MPDLVARGIHQSFGATKALIDVDFEARGFEVHALVGENGSGKSTLMRVLSGELRPDAGSMNLDGVPYAPGNPAAAHRAGVALIHQELALCPHLTVAESIVLGDEPSRGGVVRGGRAKRRAKEALAKLGRGDLDTDLRIGQLSVAMCQVVEIARALASGARVVIFDEPTSSLTESDATRLFGLVRGLRASGAAVVYITHFLDEIPQVADRVTVLRDGATAWSASVEQATPERIVRHMVGRDVHDLYPRSLRSPGEVVLRLEGLGGERKPTEANLELRRGEVLGVAGLTGSGRTELLRCVFGLDAVRRGALTVGALVGPASPARRWAQGVGMLSEDRKGEGLMLDQALAENLCLSSLSRGPWVSPKGLGARADRWVQALGIRCNDVNRPVGELSGGNQQKVALARLLEHDVDVLLLDEPTRGIDVASKATIYQTIDDLAKVGKAVLVVSSYLPELAGTCDRIAVMRRGSLGQARSVGEWTMEALMTEAAGA